jgi:ATP-dependent Lon protease
MEIIRLPGYLDQEKLAIAKQFLVPRQLRAHGIDAARVNIAADVLPAVARLYTREAGVRELERRIARIARKLARRDAERAEAAAAAAAAESATPLSVAPMMHDVTVADLQALLGTPPYEPETPAGEHRVGVATGLAYTNVGGEVLEVEVAVVEGRGKIQLTGTLGDVMKESANAALSYIRTRAAALGVDRDFYRKRDIHLHLPAGATPKDGPSAGIAIAVAMVSALTGKPVRGDVAMTGEITLRGRVLGIGGLREKAVAAHRSGIRQVIVPRENLRDVHEMPEEIRTQVHFHGVTSMDVVLAIAMVRETFTAAVVQTSAGLSLSH